MSTAVRLPAKPGQTTTARRLRVAYAIQNVGGIDFTQDIGDTVPVKQSLLGLRRAGHEVTCFMLQGREVVSYDDVARLQARQKAPQGLSGTRAFRRLESGLRKAHVKLRLPYFALFDTLRFYEAGLRVFPRYDLCHEHNGLFCAGAALACRRLGLPYVLTVSADPLFERAMIGRPLRGLQERVATWEAAFTYRLARKILCVSEAAKQQLAARWRLDPGKIVVMSNGVDADLFAPVEDCAPLRRQWGLDDGPVVAFVGGFQPWHGLDLLIEAMARVRVDVPGAQLLLVGDGRARPIVDAAIAQHNLGLAVKVTGLVPQADIPGLLGVADVAVLPYPKLDAELWFSPLKLYEYMAAGKAIVATRSGQISEVLHDGVNGRLVAPGDVPALASAITDLLRHPEERARLGLAARQTAVTYHSWDRYVERLQDVYESVL